MCKLSVIVLCGGLGTRLKSKIGNNCPKILAPIGEHYFFDYFVNWIKNSLKDIDHEIILSLGFCSDEVLKVACKSKYKFKYSFEESQNGTYPAVLEALNFCCTKNILIVNGDTLFKNKFIDNFKLFLNSGSPYLFIKKNISLERFGYEIDNKSGKLYQNNNFPNYISLGALFIKFNQLNKFKSINGIDNKLIDKELISKINPFPIKLLDECNFIDIGTSLDYEKAQYFLPKYYALEK